MKDETTKEIYTSLKSTWPDHSYWYNYTHMRIIRFISKMLTSRLDSMSYYLNAGSGGSVYKLPGICQHVDIAENLICGLDNYTVASIENLPFPDEQFDATICVGSVINYCDVVKSIAELSRTLKKQAILSSNLRGAIQANCGSHKIMAIVPPYKNTNI